MIEPEEHNTTPPTGEDAPTTTPSVVPSPEGTLELGGPAGLEPTRYGDWERRGRCIDF